MLVTLRSCCKHPETSAKTVSLRNGLSATIHNRKFTKTCHEWNLTCTDMFYNLLQWFNMNSCENMWKLYKTGWSDHAKDEGHTGRVPELRFLKHPALQIGAVRPAVASKSRLGRASQLWGWAPSRPNRHGTMHWQPRRDYRVMLLPPDRAPLKSHAELGWLIHHDIWSYFLCCYTTLLHDTTSILIFGQRDLSIHATRILALKRIRLSEGLNAHRLFHEKKLHPTNSWSWDKNQSECKCRTWHNHAEPFFWEVRTVISVLRGKCRTDCGPPTALRKVAVQIHFFRREIHGFISQSLEVQARKQSCKPRIS